jgi:outer membrane immunogenic protein
MKFGGISIVVLAIGAAAPHAALAQSGPAPAFNWTGAYVGGQVGYGWSRTDTGTTRMYEDADGLDESTYSPIPAFSYSGSGLIGGAEAGYNWQTGNVVLGIVGDVSGAKIRGSHTDDSALFSVDSTIDWLSTARINVGVPMGKVLLFGTGGLAVGGVTSELHDVYDSGSTIINSTASTTNVGWTLGAGVAAAVTPNWIVKAEYLYVDLGTENVSFSEESPGFPLITSSGTTKANVVKFAIDYKF